MYVRKLSKALTLAGAGAGAGVGTGTGTTGAAGAGAAAGGSAGRPKLKPRYAGTAGCKQVRKPAKQQQQQQCNAI